MQPAKFRRLRKFQAEKQHPQPTATHAKQKTKKMLKDKLVNEKKISKEKKGKETRETRKSLKTRTESKETKIAATKF